VSEDLYVAQIIKDDTQEVVQQSKPMSERRAEKLEDGYGINLNWEEYSTRVIQWSGGGK
jgi:hypothetical protein